MSKVFTGKLWEKVLWLIVLLASMIFVGNASLGFIEQYRAFDTLTDIKIHSVAEVPLPTFSICDTSPGGFVCYENKTVSASGRCVHPGSRLFPTGNRIYDQLHVDNRRHAILHPVYSSRCVVINPYQNLTTATLQKIYMYSINPLYGYMYIHSHNDFTIGVRDKPVAIFKIMNVNIRWSNKQMIWRLPSPYSSKCSNDGENSSIFPKPYTMAKCRNTCMFNMMLTQCGDVIQQWQIYLPRDKVSKKRESSLTCLRNLLLSDFPGLECKCPVSCYDMYVDTRVDEDWSPRPMISFHYLSNTVTEIKEVPAYPGSKFVTDIGGWLSLFTGMSVLSLLELFIFISLSIVALCRTLF